jgi:hypothetical protein
MPASRTVGQVAVMQAQFGTAEMEVVIEVVDAIGVEEACTSDQAVNFVSFREQELGKIRSR